MISLFDRVRSSPNWIIPRYGLPATSFCSIDRTMTKKEVSAATVVLLDNVSEVYERDYLPSIPRADVEWSSIPDMDFFPKLISPFPTAFYEFPITKRHFSTVWNDNWRGPVRVGFAVIREERRHRFLGFMGERDKVFLLGEGTWSTNEAGGMDGDLMVIPAGLAKPPESGWDGLPGFCGFIKLMSVMALGISFLHCKNVSLSTKSPDQKLSKVFSKRHGFPLVVYKLLTVHAMKKGSLSEDGETSEISKRLHICRGHFKDYSKSGLFGRSKGIYWWEQHARGSVRSGILVKDYDVRT